MSNIHNRFSTNGDALIFNNKRLRMYINSLPIETRRFLIQSLTAFLLKRYFTSIFKITLGKTINFMNEAFQNSSLLNRLASVQFRCCHQQFLEDFDLEDQSHAEQNVWHWPIESCHHEDLWDAFSDISGTHYDAYTGLTCVQISDNQNRVFYPWQSPFCCP